MIKNSNKIIIISHLLIEGRACIGIRHQHDKRIEKLCRNIPFYKWSSEFGMGYVFNSKENLKLIFKVFKGENIIRNSQLNVEFTDLPEPNIQEKTVDFLKSRGYSIVLVIFISIILLLILGLVIFRKKNYISKFSNYQLENIKLIAILDKKYEDNKISSEEYFSNRKKLMDEITNQTDEK